ncbi:MAG: hypothetical protein NC043_05100 [Muribaculaceae bacterium]|nr:hypothetical protein [Muribaculaceae bacterium]
MNDQLKKQLSADTDGLLTYEYIANNIGSCDDIMPELVDNIIRVDSDGQFSVSAARFLRAINAQAYADSIDRLIASGIEKDRDRRYIGSLLAAVWGPDYMERADEISATDDNFRRIYKRIFPRGI